MLTADPSLLLILSLQWYNEFKSLIDPTVYLTFVFAWIENNQPRLTLSEQSVQVARLASTTAASPACHLNENLHAPFAHGRDWRQNKVARLTRREERRTKCPPSIDAPRSRRAAPLSAPSNRLSRGSQAMQARSDRCILRHDRQCVTRSERGPAMKLMRAQRSSSNASSR